MKNRRRKISLINTFSFSFLYLLLLFHANVEKIIKMFKKGKEKKKLTSAQTNNNRSLKNFLSALSHLAAA